MPFGLYHRLAAVALALVSETGVVTDGGKTELAGGLVITLGSASA